MFVTSHVFYPEVFDFKCVKMQTSDFKVLENSHAEFKPLRKKVTFKKY